MRRRAPMRRRRAVGFYFLYESRDLPLGLGSAWRLGSIHGGQRLQAPCPLHFLDVKISGLLFYEVLCLPCACPTWGVMAKLGLFS